MKTECLEAKQSDKRRVTWRQGKVLTLETPPTLCGKSKREMRGNACKTDYVERPQNERARYMVEGTIEGWLGGNK